MTKFLLAKISSLAFAISSAALLSGCETSGGKPELCDPGVQGARCAKIPKANAVRSASPRQSSHY